MKSRILKFFTRIFYYGILHWIATDVIFSIYLAYEFDRASGYLTKPHFYELASGKVYGYLCLPLSIFSDNIVNITKLITISLYPIEFYIINSIIWGIVISFTLWLWSSLKSKDTPKETNRPKDESKKFNVKTLAYSTFIIATAVGVFYFQKASAQPHPNPNEVAKTQTTGQTQPSQPSSPQSEWGRSDLPHFGFCDTSGSQIILMSHRPQNANELSLAYDFSKHSFHAIKHLRDQKNENYTSAYNSYNFNLIEGAVYSIDQGRFEENQTYTLFSKSFLEPRKVLEIKPNLKKAFPEHLSMVLESQKGMKIRKSWCVAELSNQVEIYWIWFHTQGEKELICMTAVRGNELLTLDYPAEKGTGWRAEDGCETYENSIQIIFACENNQKLEFAYVWSAPEGGANQYAVEQDGALVESKDI